MIVILIVIDGREKIEHGWTGWTGFTNGGGTEAPKGAD